MAFDITCQVRGCKNTCGKSFFYGKKITCGRCTAGIITDGETARHGKTEEEETIRVRVRSDNKRQIEVEHERTLQAQAKKDTELGIKQKEIILEQEKRKTALAVKDKEIILAKERTQQILAVRETELAKERTRQKEIELETIRAKSTWSKIFKRSKKDKKPIHKNQMYDTGNTYESVY